MQEEIKDLRNPDVVTKYKASAEIAQGALKKAIAACVDGAVVVKICSETDAYIMEETGKMWKKNKDLIKGIGFPTCVSVNNIVGHFSPLADHTAALKAGDVVKIDLGVHFDGYNAMVAHTVVVPKAGEAEAAVSGKAADTILAAYNAAQVAARLLKAGAVNSEITKAIGEVCSDFKVNPVLGVLSHNLDQFQIDGDKVIANKDDLEHRTEKATFAENEVYCIDVVVSSAEGKPKASDERTTVFKRDPSHRVTLKVDAARQVYGQICHEAPFFPFAVRSLNSKTALFGLAECQSKELVEPYPVLTEKAGEVVAQFKFTALLMPTGTMVITGLPVNAAQFTTDKTVSNAAYAELLKTAVSDKKQKKKKATPEDAAAAAPAK